MNPCIMAKGSARLDVVLDMPSDTNVSYLHIVVPAGHYREGGSRAGQTK